MEESIMVDWSESKKIMVDWMDDGGIERESDCSSFRMTRDRLFLQAAALALVDCGGVLQLLSCARAGPFDHSNELY
jgi:hypothetical protein